MKSIIDPQKIKCIAIGASAGGLAAIDFLLQNLPPKLDQIIVIVQHISESQNDSYIDYLQRKCSYKVKFAEDKMKIESGVINIAPPNFHLLMENRDSFALNIDERVNFSRPSIDVFLESASGIFRSELMAIILTGANNDGAEGAKLIRENNGMVIVQDPDEALYRMMPEAVIFMGGADYIMNLKEISGVFNNLNNGEIDEK